MKKLLMLAGVMFCSSALAASQKNIDAANRSIAIGLDGVVIICPLSIISSFGKQARCAGLDYSEINSRKLISLKFKNNLIQPWETDSSNTTFYTFWRQKNDNLDLIVTSPPTSARYEMFLSISVVRGAGK